MSGFRHPVVFKVIVVLVGACGTPQAGADTDWLVPGDTTGAMGDESLGSASTTSAVTTTATTSTSATSGGCEPESMCAPQSVASVMASGDNGNPPTNAIDKNLDTRWSYEGADGWITLDLGASKELCGLAIAWYLGDERTTDFTVEVSSDNAQFENAYSGTTSGQTSALQEVPVTGTARYVRISGRGNSDGTGWVSISEIEIHANEVVDDCPAGDESGSDDGGIPGDGVDENGVAMLLPTDPNCFSWALAGDATSDPNFRIDGDDDFDPVQEADGSWHFKPRVGGLASGGQQLTLRLHVHGTDASENFDDHDELRARGYMTDDPDGEIGNQEMTAYLRLENIERDDDTISKKIRGGSHSDSNSHYSACVGLLLVYDGQGDSLWEKELFHPSTPKSSVDKQLEYGTAIVDGQWIGDKITSVRQPDGSVINTQYIDVDPFDAEGKPQNNWQKVFEYVDSGEDVVNWTGKYSTWRIDEAGDVYVKYPSVRCVEAP